MTIRRAPRKKQNFTVLSNELIEDSRLSWDAMGVLIYLLSKPDYWEVSVTQLVKERRGAKKALGRDAIYRILNELIELGYVQRSAEKDRAGRFAGYSYEVQEVPITANPSTDEPSTANTTLVNTVSKQGLSQSNTGDSGESPACSSESASGQGGGESNDADQPEQNSHAELEERFETFWQTCREVWFGTPGNKQEAKRRFLARVKGTKSAKPTHTPDELIALARQDARRRKQLVADGAFAPKQKHVSGWLNNAGWEDELEQDTHTQSDGLEGLAWI